MEMFALSQVLDWKGSARGCNVVQRTLLSLCVSGVTKRAFVCVARAFGSSIAYNSGEPTQQHLLQRISSYPLQSLVLRNPYPILHYMEMSLENENHARSSVPRCRERCTCVLRHR